MRRQKRDLTTWLNFVDCTEIKAFVELTVSNTIRAGAQNLLMVGNYNFIIILKLIMNRWSLSYMVNHVKYRKGYLNRDFCIRVCLDVIDDDVLDVLHLDNLWNPCKGLGRHSCLLMIRKSAP